MKHHSPFHRRTFPFRSLFTALVVALSLVCAGSAGAAIYYWDGSSVTVDGISEGGTGAWTVGAPGWEDGTSAQNWANGNDAVLAGTAGTVTLGGAVAPGNVNFNTNAYVLALANNTLTAGSLNYGGAAGVGLTITATAGTASTQNTVTLNGAGIWAAGTALALTGNANPSFGSTQNGPLLKLVFGNANALGSAELSVKHAMIQAGAPGLTIPNTIVNGGASLYFGGEYDFAVSGTITNDSTANRTLGVWQGSTTSRIITLQNIDTSGESINFESRGNASSGNSNPGGGFIVNGAIFGSGGIVLGTVANDFAGNTLTLNGASTYSGNTTINDGVLTIGNGGSLNTVGTVNSSASSSKGTLNINAGGSLSCAALSSSWGTTMTNNGILNVANTFTFSGGTSTVSGSGTNTMTTFAIQNYGTENINGVFWNIGYGGITWTQPGVLNVGATTLGAFADWSGSAPMTLTDTNIGTTVNTLDTADNTTAHALILSGVLSGPGVLVKTGAGTLTLSAANTYTGSTLVNNGTLALTSTTASTNLVLATSSAILDVSSSGSFHLTTGETLQGIGTVVGPMTVDSGATLTVAGATGTTLGVLTNTGNLTLNGTTVLRISKTGGTLASDAITGFDTLTYGGTLTVANVTSDANTLAAGDTFTLFPKGSGSYVISGFTALNLPVLPGTLSWDTSLLTSSGQIRVASTPVTAIPTFNPIAGGYVGAQTVAISCATPGATIYYTTDGTTPNNTSLSGVSGLTVLVPVNTTTTIQAYAHTNGWTDSLVASATYVTGSEAVWTNLAGGTWGTAANWTNGIVPNGSGQTADFSTLTMSADTTVTLGSAKTVGNLLFGDQGDAYSWILSGSPLTLNASTNVPVITVNNQTTTIGMLLAGTNGLVKAGAGALTFSTSQNGGYAGGTTVNAGTLNLGTGGANGCINGILTINLGATVTATAANALGYNGANTQVTNLNIYGGTFNTTIAGDQGWALTANLMGGTMDSGDGDFAMGNGFNINTLATNVSSVVAGTINTRAGNANNLIAFNVAAGTAAPDLLVNAVINNTAPGVGIVKNGAGAMTLTGANTYTGSTVISNGTLEVDGQQTGTGAVTVNSGTLDGTGYIYGPVTVNGGTVSPSTAASLGTLNIYNTLSVSTGGTVAMRISKTGGNPASDNLYGSGITYGGTLTVTNVTSDGTLFAAGDTFNLFGGGVYSGAFSTYNLPALPAGLSWDLSGLVVNGSIAVTASAPTPVFNPYQSGGYGAVGTLAVTITSESGATIYYTTDGSDAMSSGTVVSGPSPVTVVIPANTPSETLTAYASAPAGNSGETSAIYSTVSTPTWIGLYGGSWSGTYNWSNNVVANGVGVTADFSTLTLPADATVTLDIPVTVGNLIFGDQGNTNNWILADGGAGPLTLAMTNGSPTITVNNQAVTNNVVLVGSSGLTKAGAGTLTLTVDAPALTGGITVNQGTLRLTTDNFGGQFTPSIVTVNTNGILFGDNTHPLGVYSTEVINRGAWVMNDEDYTANLTMMDGQVNVGPTPDAGVALRLGYFTNSIITVSNSIVGSVINVPLATYASENATPVTNTLNVYRGMAASDLTVNGRVISNGGLVKTGNGILTLNNTTNNYSGSTMVNDGTLLVNGAITGVGAVTVAGGTLGGNGSIAGVVTVQSGGTLAPGASIGTLTLESVPVLGGTVLVEINRTNTPANADQLALTTGTLTYGGTLTVQNTGPAPQLGDSFVLFNAPAYAGSFSAINLPALGAGLNWNWTPANGMLAVVSSSGVNTTPTNVTATVSRDQLTLTWPADHTGWTLETQTNNLSTGLSATWYPVAGSSTTNSVTITIDPTQPTVFYRMVYP